MSTRLLVAAATSALVLVATAAIATPRRAIAATAEKYFGCPTGYAFQVNGSSARCYVAGSSSTTDISCGMGYVKALDQFNGGKDACQNKVSNIVGNYTCPNGYSPKVQPGPDVCQKSASPSILAPSVEKFL